MEYPRVCGECLEIIRIDSDHHLPLISHNEGLVKEIRNWIDETGMVGTIAYDRCSMSVKVSYVNHMDRTIDVVLVGDLTTELDKFRRLIMDQGQPGIRPGFEWSEELQEV